MGSLEDAGFIARKLRHWDGKYGEPPSIFAVKEFQSPQRSDPSWLLNGVSAASGVFQALDDTKKTADACDGQVAMQKWSSVGAGRGRATELFVFQPSIAYKNLTTGNCFRKCLMSG